MKVASSQTRWLAQESTRKVLRRASSSAAVLAVLAAAIGVPVMSPQPDAGTNPVLAIARADCPPDCGGGPGNGATPSGPPGGGTEFVPPSIPSMPSYDPGRGYPAPDQNNGISIYNSAAPQPSQAAQPSQAPVQNQDGTYNRAANGEQQPINHNAPSNQQLNNSWQKLSDQLNNQQGQPENSQQDKQDCESIARSVQTRYANIEPSQRYIDIATEGLGRREPGSQIDEAAAARRATTISAYDLAKQMMVSDLTHSAIESAGLTLEECGMQVTEADAYQFNFDVRDNEHPDGSGNGCSVPLSNITVNDMKQVLLAPGGFGRIFPIPNHPDNFPAIGQEIQLDAPVAIPLGGASFTVPWIPKSLTRSIGFVAPVKVESVNDFTSAGSASPSFGFTFVTLPGHFDGEGSHIKFTFSKNINSGLPELNVSGDVTDAPIGSARYQEVGTAVWQSFIDNVIQEALKLHGCQG
ncbi:Uncharacterised protein [Mycobacteroides abscessus subsp. massiliense]|nr:Uncharacterised protein [Mycobacteroides abscessus subsp. massiliense]SKH14457.1 Uncharacterised protein [Mycobacteroides abscessus subsp. massiliense]SKI02656.1 Uncharacterised protein [Mycobacteroides abscessus subsp. massiliense]SKI70712.1 Uncharacterised protein [Mycobacteroides abscessus subsp. massiliense]SKJ18519.1 Uncharacterised protein [Mycobacteroides abscessus subsp. massiliense]